MRRSGVGAILTTMDTRNTRTGPLHRRAALGLLVAALAWPLMRTAGADDQSGKKGKRKDKKKSRKKDRQQERARAAVARGEYLPLQQIVDDALARHPGVVISVELDDDEYEIEILRNDGVVIELEYDARTGRLLEEEIEDD